MAASDLNLISEYQKENKALKGQIAEMEAFLNDYGLVWVGYRDDCAGSENLENSIWFDMKHMIIALKELNESVTANNKHEIVRENGVHK